MERMEQRDLEAFLTIVREIYAHCGLDSFASHIVSTLPKAIPSEWTSYNEVNLRSQTNTYVMEPLPSDFPEAEQIFAQYIPEHPIIMHHQETQDGRALKISDFLTQHKFHRLGLYNEFFQRLEVEHQMAVVLPAPASLVIGIALNRSGKDFSERDRILLNLLGPHLVQAYHNAKAVTRMQQDSARVKRAVEELDRGVIALAEKCRITWCTEQVRRWILEYFDPPQRTDQLPESLQRWIEHQRSLLSEDGSVPPPRKPLVLERAGKRLVVRLVEDHSEEDGCFLLVEEQHVPFSERSLETFGLTHREAEVLLWIARGKTNNEVASALYIIPSTVKKHLEHIYEKFGVESRTEAIARALEFSAFFADKP
jgi:DNA-binding CsgD family transcriptional regulator